MPLTPPVDWAHVVETHEPALRRLIAKRMANQELVDDALQETYLRAMRRGRGTPDARWFRTVARRASTDVYRREPPPATDLDAIAVTADVMLPGSDEHLESVEWRQSLRWALARLSPRHRRVLALRAVHELTYQEIGAVENLSQEAVTAALNRARVRLRAHLYAYENRRAVPAVGLWLGHTLRRLRWRLQEMGPRAAEWAGATLTLGVVAVMTVPMYAPAQNNPAVEAGVAWTDAAFVQDMAAEVEAATTMSVQAPQPRPTAPSGGTGSAAPPVDVPLIVSRPDVRLDPDRPSASYTLEINDPTGGNTLTTSTEIDCTASWVRHAACWALFTVDD